MDFGLKLETIDKINSIFKKYPQIDTAILYGSRAKGNYRNGSDIDITLSGDGLNHNIIGDVNLEIDDLLLPYMVDLSIFKQISNPDLVEHIQRVGKVFYQKATS